MERIQIDYLLKGEVYASRWQCHVPAVGDDVKFLTNCFVVVRRVFLYFGDVTSIDVDIERVENPE